MRHRRILQVGNKVFCLPRDELQSRGWRNPPQREGSLAGTQILAYLSCFPLKKKKKLGGDGRKGMKDGGGGNVRSSCSVWELEGSSAAAFFSPTHPKKKKKRKIKFF